MNDYKGMAEDMSSDDSGGQDQTNSLDSAISKVKSYIANPRLVTPQTLQDLLSDLMDFKSEEDQEPADEEAKYHGGSGSGKGGLAIMIGMPKGESK